MYLRNNILFKVKALSLEQITINCPLYFVRENTEYLQLAKTLPL